ncbi:phosphoglycerate mutase [Hylemonella gracilis str. Niagara R]|uniref:Phosphoglycerate mutase n=1 Tax=Hylemonella gracilis str. Niagara R TaxID=1458275 RepID=A0A016XK92_9BURK|nr:histidine phosphatase family protein [Hylemonella gracilis]EYC51608.1 phosphoglycerate mutase [Hylemonella gracilis str. Niagara R]
MMFTMLLRRGLALFALVAVTLPVPALEVNDDALWSLLKKGGQVVLVRHAQTTPGVGDPVGMTLNQCATQRNLNDEGRREATLLGEALRRQGVSTRLVLSSPWCRCIETARLVFGHAPQNQVELGNLFDRPEQASAQTQALRRLLAEVTHAPSKDPGNVFMFTHGSTVHALLGLSPATAEMVILTPEPGGFRLAGRLLVRQPPYGGN